MNNFLKTRKEVDDCTQWLIDNDLIQSGLSCKNYDIAMVMKELVKLDLRKDHGILDMGSSGSEILSNAVKIKMIGRKVGIDLAYKEHSCTDDWIEYFRGDLTNVPIIHNSVEIITCMSVVEHNVNIYHLSKECARVLISGGHLFISFDYWPEKIDTKGAVLYSLDWNILSKEDVLGLINDFKEVGFELTSEIDWTTQDAVITPQYCSPAQGISYTFGILQFVKK